MKPLLKFLIVLFTLVFILAGCSHQKGTDPEVTVQSQHPDKKLFEAAIENMAEKKYVNAVTLLQTLISSYPDSPYVDRAKLALDDCSHQVDCGAMRAQIETLPNGGGMVFFPNMPQNDCAPQKFESASSSFTFPRIFHDEVRRERL
jgi:hypothetical protein